MSQTAILQRNDGTDEISLPDLPEDKIIRLGLNLDMLRAACVLSPRARQEPFRILVKKNYIGYGSPLYAHANQMKAGQDRRKEIIELEDETFHQFIMLAADVAQDNSKTLDLYGKILTAFGMIGQ